MPEFISLTYSKFMSLYDEEGKESFRKLFRGEIDAEGRHVVEDERLPGDIQGKSAPAWWNGDEDPFADQFDLGSVTL